VSIYFRIDCGELQINEKKMRAKDGHEEIKSFFFINEQYNIFHLLIIFSNLLIILVQKF